MQALLKSLYPDEHFPSPMEETIRGRTDNLVNDMPPPSMRAGWIPKQPLHSPFHVFQQGDLNSCVGNSINNYLGYQFIDAQRLQDTAAWTTSRCTTKGI